MAHRSAPIPSPGRAAARRSLRLAFAALLVVAGSGALLTAGALEVHAAATAFVAAESRWSQGAEGALTALQLYLATDDEAHLDAARRHLAVPLGHREARLAMEGDPPDVERAREGFRRGGSAPADVTRMIRFYRLFGSSDYGLRLVGLWRVAEAQVLRLQSLCDALTDAGSVTPELRASAGATLDEVAAALRPLESAFANRIAAARDGVRRWVTAASAVGFVLVVTLVAWAGGRAVQGLRAAERNFRLAFEAAGVGMARLDPNGRLVESNDALARMVRRAPGELAGMHLRDLIHPDDPLARARVDRIVRDEAPTSGGAEHRLLRSDGSVLWAKLTLSPLASGFDERGGLFAVVDDVTEAHERAVALSFQAHHDTLTGLANRHELEARLQSALASARRRGVTHALCFIDLDGFKIVNDTCGHLAGDELLKQVASVFVGSSRANDTVARIGGDEFALLLDHTDAEEAHQAAEKMRHTLAANVFHWRDRTFDVSCSIGIVAITREGPALDGLVRAADEACYAAKAGGGNRVVFFEGGDVPESGAAPRSLRVRDAIDEQRLTLRAEPIAAAAGPAGLRYEVVAHLRDDDGAVHPPEAFAAAAERDGVAAALDLWVLRRVLADLAGHPAHVARLSRCFVNVSAASLAEATLAATVGAALRERRLGDRVAVGLPEVATTDRPLEARALSAAVREAGGGVSLDGFRGGPAAVTQLQSLPVELLKIDAALVRHAARSDLDRAVLQAVHDVAVASGCRTLAQGVASAAVRQEVEALGVHFVQGPAVMASVAFAGLVDGSVELPSTGR